MPEIDELRQHMQKLAVLTAIFSVDLGEPQFVFEPTWARNEQVAIQNNGCGDELYIHFCLVGCFIKGFAHESEMTPYKRDDMSIWPGVIDSVPPQFESSMNEPAFELPATTFLIWRLKTDAAWQVGNIPFPPGDYRDGSADLLEPLGYNAIDFADWLEENYEMSVDAEAVVSVFEGRPLTLPRIRKLNPTSSLAALKAAVMQTGYPLRTDG